MAIYTRNEFAAFLGIDKNPRQIIKSNIDRGKIVLNENGDIDDTVPANADFKKRYLEIRKQKVGAPIDQQPKAKKDPVELSHETTAIHLAAGNKKVQNAAVKTTLSKFDLELKKTEADIEKKLIDTELSKVKLSVLMGGNIPVSVVKTIISTLSKSILSNYKSFQDQLITEVCHEYKIDNANRTKILSKAVTGLNAIHTKAVSESRIQLKNAIGTNQNKLAIEDEQEEN